MPVLASTAPATAAEEEEEEVAAPDGRPPSSTAPATTGPDPPPSRRRRPHTHTHTPPAQSRSPGGPSFADASGLSPARSLDAAASATWTARAVAVPAGTTSAELSAGLALPQGRL